MKNRKYLAYREGLWDGHIELLGKKNFFWLTVAELRSVKEDYFVRKRKDRQRMI